MDIKKINKNWMLLGGGVALGTAAIFLNNKVISTKMAELEAEASRGQRMVTVVVPIKDLAKGTPLTPDLVAARKVPQQYAHAAAITPERFGTYVNERLSAPVGRGEALLESHIDGMGNRVFSTLLSNGMRALTFEVDEISSISGMLRPGDKVDLIFRTKEVLPAGSSTESKEVIFPLLSNITVLATGQTVTKRTPEGAEQSFSAVTMEVTPADAERILLAKANGNLTAVLRHPDDAAPNGAPRLAMADLMAPGQSTKKERLIQYILGGGGSVPNVSLVPPHMTTPGKDAASLLRQLTPAALAPSVSASSPLRVPAAK